jgi:serine protease Do
MLYFPSMWRKFLPLFLLIFLCACTSLPVEKVLLQSVPEAPQDAHPSPVGFNQLRYAIPTGTTTIGYSMRSPRCPMVMRRVQQGINVRLFVDDTYRRLFRDTLAGQGYDITGDPGRMFDEEEDLQRTVYGVGARIIDIKMDICEEQGLLGDLGYIGEAMMEVEWTVYDMLHRVNAYKVTTKGYSALSAPNDEGIALLLEDSFAAAIHNLGADKQFFDMVFTGAAPLNRPETISNPDDIPLTEFDPQEKVILPTLPSGEKLLAALGKLPASSVLIQTAGGHGSGFFITKQGHILTNAHVVGNAPRVRVVTSGKKGKLIAEVLRIDRVRDVALLRLEEAPDFEIELLPLRMGKPEVSEEIYAIGAPGLTKLQDTVTKGIVSAYRYDRQKKLWFIQGDVYVIGGSSGGPLLDSHGNVVGITVAGYGSDEQTLDGLNLFIPIADALDRLAIGVSGAASPPLDLIAD